MMNTFTIAKWEFNGMIRNRQFILFTALFPLIFLVFGFLSIILAEPSVTGAFGLNDPGQYASVDEFLAALDDELPVGYKTDVVIPTGIAIAFSMIFLFVVLFSGTFVLQNIVREKQSRVVEILLAAVEPRDLISGKILSFGALGLVQALIWVGVGAFALLIVGPYLGVPIWLLFGAVLAKMPWDVLWLFFIYFALGYLFISSFSAAMGATMTDVLSGQQIQSLIIALPSALPLIVLNVIFTSPSGFIPTLFSYLPPTIPGTMMLRLSIHSVPALEIIASIFILLLSIFVVMRLGSRVFEVGILLYGKTASLKEIWRWARRKSQ